MTLELRSQESAIRFSSESKANVFIRIVDTNPEIAASSLMLTPDPAVVEAFGEMEWTSAPDDESTLQELELRLMKAAASKRGDPLYYSDWVRDVTFVVPQYNGGMPFQMLTDDWKAYYQHVIGGTLGLINARSYSRHGILLSSMAINREEHRPGDRYFGLSREVGLLKGKSEMEELKFWTEQMEIVRTVAKEVASQADWPEWEHVLAFVREGEKGVANVTTRTRCAALVDAAKDAHRSADGTLRCSACGWFKPQGPIRGDIVEMHHLEHLSASPEGGKKVSLADAKDLLSPLCPNCHRISHSKTGGGSFSIEEVMGLVLA